MRPLTPAEGTELNELDRSGDPYLAWRDDTGAVRTLVLNAETTRYGIGRHPGSDICLLWDEEVSRAPAVLVQVGGQWAIEDDGLSLNGTRVNSTRIARTRRLDHGDQILVGATTLEFRHQAGRTTASTRKQASRVAAADMLSPAQRRVLAALAGELREAPPGTPVPSNAKLASVLQLGEETIKTHIRDIYALLELSPDQPDRRGELARRALELGFDLES